MSLSWTATVRAVLGDKPNKRLGVGRMLPSWDALGVDSLSDRVLRWEKAARSVLERESYPRFTDSLISFKKTTAPHLVLSSTLVETGEVAVFSPLGLFRYDTAVERLHHYALINPDLRLSIADAVVMSSRFPLVTPPAFIANQLPATNEMPEIVRFVDGGYYENSGVKVVGELMGRALAENGAILIKFSDELAEPYSVPFFPELSSMIVGLLNTRAVRGYEFGRTAKDKGYHEVLSVDLATKGFQPILGWLITEKTQIAIGGLIPVKASQRIRFNSQHLNSLADRNAYVACRVLTHLGHRSYQCG